MTCNCCDGATGYPKTLQLYFTQNFSVSFSAFVFIFNLKVFSNNISMFANCLNIKLIRLVKV